MVDATWRPRYAGPVPTSRSRLRVRGRSFIAISLAPEPPVADWLAELDDQIQRAPGFFAERPVVVDLSALGIDDPALGTLHAELQSRGVRVVGVEGVPAAIAEQPGWNWPPAISGGRKAGQIEVPEAEEPPPPEPAAPEPPACLIIDRPVRSGQTVMFPAGDVTVLGAVSSGAEIIAGGSIHIYGPLRGRAIAGFTGNSKARIFCRKLEAELLAIDGLYRTADEIDPALRGRAAQAWLVGEDIKLAALV